MLVSINSSPFVQGKPEDRLRRLVGDDEQLTLVYVNQWGGQDELVFDGQSFVADRGQLRYCANQVERDEFAVVDLEGTAAPAHLMPAAGVTVRSARLDQLIVMSLRDYARKSGFSDAVVASSGGVDSALTIALACEALGPNHVHAIRMPSVYSSDHSKSDAMALHQALGCWDYEVEIEHLRLVESLNHSFDRYEAADHLVTAVHREGRYNAIADQNVQARCGMFT